MIERRGIAEWVEKIRERRGVGRPISWRVAIWQTMPGLVLTIHLVAAIAWSGTGVLDGLQWWFALVILLFPFPAMACGGFGVVYCLGRSGSRMGRMVLALLNLVGVGVGGLMIFGWVMFVRMGAINSG